MATSTKKKTRATKARHPARKTATGPAARKTATRRAPTRKAAAKPAAKAATPTRPGTKPKPKTVTGKEPPRSAPALAEVDAEVLEFIAAIDRFKQEHSRPFPSWSEILLVIRNLGYRRS
ncbi:MAG: hypothetical protein KDC98_12030 [Planctomycetes bacterium]|nr:hypothetical protein [Planctomycetota bacterium]